LLKRNYWLQFLFAVETTALWQAADLCKLKCGSYSVCGSVRQRETEASFVYFKIILNNNMIYSSDGPFKTPYYVFHMMPRC